MGTDAAITVRPSGLYATYRGIEHRVVNGGTYPDGRPYVNMILGPSDSEKDFDDVFDSVEPGQRLARVPTAQLDRYERVSTTGRYDGQEIWLEGVGDPVPCRFLGDPQWAAEHGFTGSQHDGWTGEVDLDQITHITERVTDLLAYRSST